LSVDGDADAAVETRIQIGWNKFRQLAGFPLVLKSLEKCLNFTHSNIRPLKVLKNDNGA